jgi:SAM-dependent methyltransferase
VVSDGRAVQRAIGARRCDARGVPDDFDQLIREASGAPADSWDFGWLEGRATEERPSWRYFDRVAERLEHAHRLLDLDTGTGNMLVDLPRLPPLTVATDAYEPSIEAAAQRLRSRGAQLVRTQGDRQALPFADATFDLIISRHPIESWWPEIARVLEPGGHYFSQQVGPHSLRELSELLMGPLPAGSKRDPELARRAAEGAGLIVEDLQFERNRVVFHDIGAVVYFLRVVVWTVPDFSVSRYRPQLLQLHNHIQATGAFETTSSRFLIDARRPA